MPVGLAGLSVTVLLQALSALGNRRGHVEPSCWLYLIAPLLGGTLCLLLMPRDMILLSLPVSAFCALPIIQAGFLLDRRAPLIMASISSLALGLSMAMHAQAYAAVALFGRIGSFAVGAVLMVVFFTLALAARFYAGQLSRAMARADRTEEIARLYADLQASHQALEEKSAEVQAQAAELAALNRALMAMQAELEGSYRRIAEANRHLEEQASTDAMTGLPNHRVFQQTLRTQIAQALRHQQPLALLMLDVDHFKRYNDRFGHPAGDALLCEIGLVLQSAVREGDLAARYGGEEFAVILPHTEIAAAIQVAERVRAAMEAHVSLHERVTVSVGAAALYLHAHDADSLILAADTALYLAKERGRNRVEVAPPPDPFLQASLLSNGHGPVVRAARSASKPGLCNSVITLELPDDFGGIEGILQEPAGHILTALLAALDARDAETQGHSQRVARYAMRLARSAAALYDRLREERPLTPWMTPADFRDLALGALLHDIGKIGVPDYILRKPGPLTEEEWAVMRRHPVIGAELVCDLPLLAPALPVIRHHHERWDGQGYPDGLDGERIPLAARLFALCDTLDAITTDRPYRKARPFEVAREEIEKGAGTQFDPLLVQAFLEVPEKDWEGLRHAAGSPKVQRIAA